VLSVTLPEIVVPAVCPSADTADVKINRIANERFVDMSNRADHAPKMRCLTDPQ
jgi:hypothetical protein